MTTTSSANGPKKPLTSAQVQQSFRDRQKARTACFQTCNVCPFPCSYPHTPTPTLQT